MGYVLDNTDCDDTDFNINPSATEVCDGVDNNS
ncbi:MAG: putative metal-binding motif-containing protein [Flavobacteriales bacterium]